MFLMNIVIVMYNDIVLVYDELMTMISVCHSK